MSKINKIRLKNGDTRWEVRIWTNGRGSKHIKRRFIRKIDAENFLLDLKARIKSSKLISSPSIDFEETSLREEAEIWWNLKSPTWSPGTRKRTRGILDRYLLAFGNFTPNRFHSGFLTELQARRINQEIAPTTINREISVLVALLNFSAQSQRIPFNPTRGIKKLKITNSEVNFWEFHEAEGFLAFANQKYPIHSAKRWIYLVYLLAINTGIRAGEIWGLQSMDLIDEGRILRISRQFHLEGQAYTPTKGKKARLVPCMEDLQKELIPISLKTSGPLFHSKKGKPIDHHNFVKWVFKKDIKELGIKPIRFHELRHTAITLMLANGLDIKTVQEIAGHQDLKTTLGYAHLLGDRIKLAAQIHSIKPSNGKSSQLKLVQ